MRALLHITDKIKSTKTLRRKKAEVLHLFAKLFLTSVRYTDGELLNLWYMKYNLFLSFCQIVLENFYLFFCLELMLVFPE